MFECHTFVVINLMYINAQCALSFLLSETKNLFILYLIYLCSHYQIINQKHFSSFQSHEKTKISSLYLSVLSDFSSLSVAISPESIVPNEDVNLKMFTFSFTHSFLFQRLSNFL